MSIRVLLADDHTLVREGLRGLLEAKLPQVQVVGGAASGVETLQMVRELKPDLLLLDISMPGLGGLEVLAELQRERPDLKVIIVSQHTDRAYVMRALKLGAKGYLAKRAMAGELVAGILAVLEGRTFLDPTVADLVVEAAIHPGSGDEATDLALLTDREREVLKLTADGQTARQVAKVLNISVHTVNRHRATLMTKLNVHSRGELVKRAIQLKVISA
jgi:DNA-binding NarL/FixJ family response regulator